MTPTQREVAYATSSAVFSREITRADAITTIAATGVPRSSAGIIVAVYIALRRGRVFKRALSEADMDRFLQGIDADEGSDALVIALNAFARHISYRESVGSAQRGNKALYAKHTAQVFRVERQAPRVSGEDPFQEEVLQSAKDAKSRRARLESAPRLPRKVPSISFVFERNPDVVAEVLDRAAGTCEICWRPAPFNRARDNTPYLEVHHRTPLADGGEDTVENAVAACPNCHRQQHYG